MEKRERERNIEHNTSKARSDTRVEAHGAFSSEHLSEAISETLVLVSINSLHLGLDDVNRVVCHHGAETSESTREKISDDLGLDVLLEQGLGIGENDETYTLVR